MLASLLDAFDVMMARPLSPSCPPIADARRLAARARERGSVLVVSGWGGRAGWPEAGEVQSVKAGVGGVGGAGPGSRPLRGRRVEVVSGGRGAAARRAGCSCGCRTLTAASGRSLTSEVQER